MRILFLYPKFYPVTGGGTVHGYYLAKELSKLGNEIVVYNEQDDGFTTSFSKKNIALLMYNIVRSDIVYLRVSTGGIANFLTVVCRCLGKKVVAEVNAPSEELLLEGKGRKSVNISRFLMKLQLKFASRVVAVSEEVAKFLKSIGIESFVIGNGGNKFDDCSKVVSDEKAQIINLQKLEKKYSKVILWSGNVYSWQGTTYIQRLLNDQRCSNIGFIVISDDLSSFKNSENLLLVSKPSRAFLGKIIRASNLGLAPYDLSTLTKWGFYNSPLKVFEYLANNITVVTNARNSQVNESISNIRFFDNYEELVNICCQEYPREKELGNYRSWRDVAVETNELLRTCV